MMDEEGEQYVAYFLPTDDTLAKIEKNKNKEKPAEQSTSKETGLSFLSVRVSWLVLEDYVYLKLIPIVRQDRDTLRPHLVSTLDNYI